MGVGVVEWEVADTTRLCLPVQRQQSDEVLPGQYKLYNESIVEKWTKHQHNLNIKRESLKHKKALSNLSVVFDSAHAHGCYEDLEQKIRDNRPEEDDDEVKIMSEQEASEKKEKVGESENLMVGKEKTEDVCCEEESLEGTLKEGDSIEEKEGDLIEEKEGDSIEEKEGDSIEEKEGDSIEEKEGDSIEEKEGDSIKEMEGDSIKEMEGDSIDLNKADWKNSGQFSSQAPVDVKNADIKVKKAANETNGGGGGGGGQINQSKAVSDTPAVGKDGRKFAARGGNGACGDGDEEEEDRRRRRRSDQYKKHLDCDRPGAKKNSDETKTQNSPGPSRPDEGNQLPPGARPKAPRGMPSESGDISGQLGMLSLRNPSSMSNVGPAGDEWPRSVNLEDSNSPQKSLPCTSRNKKAFKRLYRDNGVNTPHKIQHRAGAVEQDSKSPEEPMEVSPEEQQLRSVDIPQTVVQGRPRDVIVLAHHLGRHKKSNPFELQGMGVVMDKDLADSYREGDYTKRIVLGKGSFGDVYLVETRNSRYVVAKQILLEKFSPDEAILLCELDHPNILPFLGLVFSDNMVTLLFEYHPCQTLQQLVKNEGVLGQGRALEIICQVFEALVYLQSKQIVHKDIKAENILISPEGHIWLIDFGVAMILQGRFHADKIPEGTPCYMAPEIAGSTSYDHRADVWSAICTLICLLSGSPPWAKRFPHVIIKFFIIFMRAAPLEDIPPNTHPEVRRFIEMTLIKEVIQRPTAAQALDLIPRDVVDELYNTPAIESPAESDPKPVTYRVGIPDDAFAGPLTPQTPRGPEDKHPLLAPGIPTVDDIMSSLFLPQEDNCGIEDGSPHSVPIEDVESGPSDQPTKPASSSMEVDDSDEDMYGPPPANDVQEEYDDIVISLPDRADDASCNQHERRLISRGIGGGPQNKEAASSYMCDDANPCGLSAGTQSSSSSFELDINSPEGECTSLSTAYAEMVEFSKVPSLEDLGSDEVDNGGAFRGAARSSGFDSRRPSTEEEQQPSGVFVTVFMEKTEQVERMITPQLTVQELAQEIVILPEFRNLRLATQQITLVLKQTSHALPLDHTFPLGKHELVAMPKNDVINWLWSIDLNGNITVA